MSEDDNDKDLFGDPVIKKKTRTARTAADPKEAPRIATALPEPGRVRSYLWRLMTEGAHDGAVKIVGTGLAAGFVAAVGLVTQWQYDWIGKTKAEIGEWTTTVERAK